MGATTIVLFIILPSLVITIALLVKFIRMTDDIKALRKHFVGEEIEQTNIGIWVFIYIFCIIIFSIIYAASNYPS